VALNHGKNATKRNCGLDCLIVLRQYDKVSIASKVFDPKVPPSVVDDFFPRPLRMSLQYVAFMLITLAPVLSWSAWKWFMPPFPVARTNAGGPLPGRGFQSTLRYPWVPNPTRPDVGFRVNFDERSSETFDADVSDVRAELEGANVSRVTFRTTKGFGTSPDSSSHLPPTGSALFVVYAQPRKCSDPAPKSSYLTFKLTERSVLPFHRSKTYRVPIFLKSGPMHWRSYGEGSKPPCWMEGIAPG
jgi:hypothetical protein